MTRPSRLWDTFGLSIYGVFAVFQNDVGQIAGDAEIVSLTITHGSGVPTGLTVGTFELVTLGERETLGSSDTNVSIWFTSEFRDRINELCGLGWDDDPDGIQKRMTARIAAQTVTDLDDRRGHLRTTKITGSEWLGLATEATTGAVVTRDNGTAEQMFMSFVDRMNIYPLREGEFTRVTITGYGVGSRYFDPADPDTVTVPASEVIDAWVEKAGSLLRTRRDGVPDMYEIQARQDLANQWKLFSPVPLMRQHVLSPVEWVLPATVPRRGKYTYRTTAGVTSTTVSVGAPSRLWGAWPLEESNMERYLCETAGDEQFLLDALTARVSRSTSSGYRVERVTVDVLHLMNRNWPLDRALVGQLLRAEVGDPIALSLDWPTTVSGVYHILQAEHRVTHNSWTITLQLAPHNHIAGQPSPDVTGATWDTRHPATTTWDTVPATDWDNA